jgi:hypothetical protein
MSITVAQADISNMAPELAGETSGRVGSFISIATSMVSESRWGTTKANFAVIYLTCHLMTMANRGQSAGGAGGQITQNKVDQLTQSYSADQSEIDKDLMSTAYGKMYLGLRNTVPTVPLIV